MKKFLAICLAFLLFSAVSCEREKKYHPESGEYLLRCTVDNVIYELSAVISDDLSCKITFDKDSALSDWYYAYDHGSGAIKYRTSLGEERDADNDRIRMIFELLLGESGVISDVSDDTLDGHRVSVLVISDGRKVYEDPDSGRPLCLVYEDMKVDIVSFPSKGS